MLRCARRRWPSASSEPTTAPRSRRRSSPHAPPSRATAACRAGSASNQLWPRNGGAWLRTSWVTEGPLRGVVAMLRSYGVEGERHEAGDDRVRGRPGLRERADQRLLEGADDGRRGQSGVKGADLAGHDRLVEQLGEDALVGALVLE